MRRWSAGAKIIVLSVAGLLLGIGLCSLAPNFLEESSWQGSWGTLLFWGSLLGLIVGIVTVFIQGIRRDD
jgi:MFS family permease